MSTDEGKQLVLVTGGARAGKSDFAQRLAQWLSSHHIPSPSMGEGQGEGEFTPIPTFPHQGGRGFTPRDGEKGKKRPVLFVATAEAGDAEMEERIRRHRASRPVGWRSLEEPIHLPLAIAEALTPNPSPTSGRGAGGEGCNAVVLVDCLNLWVSNLLLQGQGKEPASIEAEVLDSAKSLLDCYERGRATFILVSNEVGLGLVPAHPLGRQFRDMLGKVNQMVAARADKVYLLVAGLPLELKSLSSQHLLPWEGPR